MDKKVLQKVIALVFIKGEKDFPECSPLNKLATEISKNLKNEISSKTLVNYHKYYFSNGKKENPNTETINILLQYINYQNLKQFKENLPEDSILDKVPFINKKEPIINADKNKETNTSIHINNINLNSNNLNSHNLNSNNTLFGILGILSLLIIAAFFFYPKEHQKEICGYWNGTQYVKIPCDAPNKGVQIQTININQLNIQTFRKISPNSHTEFFDKQTNAPKVWYAVNKSKLEFFNESGVHPTLKTPLKPITKSIAKKYYTITKLPVNKEQKTTITPKKRKQNTQKSTLKSSVINLKNNKKISIFIFDSINKIDKDVRIYLKKEFTKQHFLPISNFDTSNKLTPTTIKSLQSFTIDALPKTISNHTDYLCVGNISYSFFKSTIIKSRMVCSIQLSYTIVATKTGNIIQSYSEQIVANGTNKINAKNNAFKKIKL